MSARYVIKPLADRDLDDYAFYLTERASLDVAKRFFAAADRTFALLARYLHMGWWFRGTHRRLQLLRVFRVSGFERMLILYRPLEDGVDILRVVHGSRNLQALFRRPSEIGG